LKRHEGETSFVLFFGTSVLRALAPTTKRKKGYERRSIIGDEELWIFWGPQGKIGRNSKGEQV
jgi:hypothetical protein